jgi:hypothetical protein
MKQVAPVGDNRTGVKASDGRSVEMQKEMERYAPSSTGSVAGVHKLRIEYASEGLPIGSVPSADGARGAEAESPQAILVDRMGERLAFERSGTRLYEALVSKHEAFGGFDGGPSRADLIEILNQEHNHFVILAETIQNMGGDPTVMTPSADTAATMAQGICSVITDPRTSLLQSLEAIMMAELADNVGWEALAEHATRAGQDELATMCEQAHQIESEHLAKVQLWLRAGQGRAR